MKRTLSLRACLLLLQAESAIAYMSFALPLFTIFYKDEIGMKFAQIGFSQAAYLLVNLTLQVPAGWLADRYGRKKFNILGDLIAASAYACYAFTDSFGGVLLAEAVIGLGFAFSDGADVGQRRAYVAKLVLINECITFRRISAQVSVAKKIAQGISFLIGGIFCTNMPRLAIGLTAVSLVIAALCVALVPDISPRATQRRELIRCRLSFATIRQRITSAVITAKQVVKTNQPLRWRIIAISLLGESGTTLTWTLTPLLLLIGASGSWIGVSWLLRLGCEALGSFLVSWFGHKLRLRTIYTVGCGLFIVPMLLMTWRINVWTVCSFALIGLARGLADAVRDPFVLEHVPDTRSTLVVSITMGVGSLVYCVALVITGLFGDHSVRLEIPVCLALFAPGMCLAWYKLRRHEIAQSTRQNVSIST